MYMHSDKTMHERLSGYNPFTHTHTHTHTHEVIHFLSPGIVFDLELSAVIMSLSHILLERL